MKKFEIGKEYFDRTGRSSMNARFKSAVVTGHTAFPGNLVFGPETTALAPPTGDFHIHAAADTLNIVFPGFLGSRASRIDVSCCHHLSTVVAPARRTA